MKSYLLPIVLFLATYSVDAQKKAVTETGEEVLLFDNNTWKYANDTEAQIELKSIPVNSKSFTKSNTSSFLLKSTKASMGVWIDNKKWQFKKAIKNDEAEYEFQSKQGDLYAMLISEKIEIPIESLKKIAIDNAKQAAPDIQVIKEEYRTVNGNKVLLMQMQGTITGIKFVYYGYYYSNEKGTIQLISYTSQNLFKTEMPNAEEFLNGLVTLD
jgi:hypothetical protein